MSGKRNNNHLDQTTVSFKRCHSDNKMDNDDFIVLDTPCKSPNDKKQYKLIKLQNELLVLLVSDPTKTDGESEDIDSTEDQEDTEDHSDPEEELENEGDGDETDDENEEKLAAACLCIDVGSFSDPESIPGLAHFLEHMIFMGSEKYPKENEYDSYIQKCGGSDNANTDCEETKFYFDITENHFEGALDRMAQLFTKPLMLKDAMSRERLAVDSEFSSEINDDGVRSEQILISLGNPKHPCSKFTWGNLKTLKDNVDDDELYRKVHEFCKLHYSAHRMYLCLQAKLSFAILEEYAVKYFAEIPNNNLKPIDFSPFNEKNAFRDDFFKKVYFVMPVKDINKVEFNWCLPTTLPLYKVKPDDFVSTILGYEGKGSLCAYLKKKLWAVDVCAGTSSSGFTNNSIYTLFTLEISLTDMKYLENVISAVSSYLKLMADKGPSEKLYHEQQLLASNAFKFKNEVSPMKNVCNLSECMKYYPYEHIINGPDLYFEYDAKEIETIIHILNERKFNCMISSYKPYKNVVFNQTEEWFGANYAAIDMPIEWIDLWDNAPIVPEFHLPESNNYICSNFDLYFPTSDSIEKLNEFPEKIFQNEVCELWYKPDNKFGLPQAHMNFYFFTPLALASSKSKNLLRLYILMLQFELNETLYPAASAGLGWELYTSDKGFMFKVSGYNEKIHLVIEVITKHMRKTVSKPIDETLFKTISIQYIRSLHNSIKLGKSLTGEIRASILQNTYWDLISRYKEMHQITIDDLTEFNKKLLDEVNIKCLIQGNVLQDEALLITKNLLNNLECSKIKDSNSIEIQINQLPSGNRFVCVESFIQANVNSEITNYYQIGPFSFRKSALVQMLNMLMEEPVFDILRTKEQLGYHVTSEIHNYYGILGYSITVFSQEDKNKSIIVEQKIEEFRKKFHQILMDMDEENFELLRTSLIKFKQNVDTKLSKEVERNWSEIVSQKYIFDRRKIEIVNIRKITKSEIIEFHQKLLEEPQKLSIQVIGDPNANSNMEIAADKVNPVENSEDGTQSPIDYKLMYLDIADSNPSNEYLKNILDLKKKLSAYPVCKTII